ncbi:MAG: radical SAM protein, partial [Opitutaceae bacterium]|nr:radical SAM protein [Opitutaceae bacterium]
MSKGPLLTLRLDLINKCNLQCVMCHYSDPKIALRPTQKISVEQFDKWFKGVGHNVRDIMLSCGDEPLMSPHFIDILTKISNYGNSLDVGLCTNGMLMNAKIRSAMIQHGLTYSLFSIDGATKKTMER